LKAKKFKAEILSGHKDAAVEVPFDPAKEWGIEAKALWRGRRGHEVEASINGVPFEAFIVPRQKNFYLLIDAETERAAGVSEGDVVSVTMRPHQV
jgi:hypothetical protein